MIVIIGGGYAGAATARWLAIKGADVVLLEAEPQTARHASGLNAGLIGALLTEDPPMIELQLRSARMIRKSFGMDPCGSVLLTTDEDEAEGLRRRALDNDIEVELVPTSRLIGAIPFLEGAASGHAVRLPSEGMVDPVVLARRYLTEAEDAGARVVTGARVEKLLMSGNRVTGVGTAEGTIEADVVVNAAGAWAGGLAESIGRGALSDMGLRPYRRHLFTLAKTTRGLSAPWVWDLSHAFYVRTDADSLTLCACDEEPHAASLPSVSPDIGSQLAEKGATAMPALDLRDIRTVRACLRTFTEDRRYLIGRDPRVEGFFWVAGLGGSGATASAAIGELAAAMILELPIPEAIQADLFSPARIDS